MGLSNVLGEIESSHGSAPAAQHLLGPSRVYEPPPDLSSNAELYKDKNIEVLLLRTLYKCKVILCGASVCSFFSFHHQPTLLFLCLTLLYCPSHSLSTSSVALLWPFTLSVLLLSLNLLLPWLISSSFASHLLMLFSPALLPFFPSPSSAHVLLCQLFCRRWRKAVLVLEKCPKIQPVLGDIMESGLTFSTKCHCRQANPRYRVEEIDQLYDIRWHTGHTQHTNIQVCSPKRPKWLNDRLLLGVLLTYKLNKLYCNFTFTDLSC